MPTGQAIWRIYSSRRPEEAARIGRIAEEALGRGILVVALGRGGKPIIPPDWHTRNPSDNE